MNFLRKLVGIFDHPKFPSSLPKPKSPLRLQCESEWSEAVNSAGRALCLAGLGILSAVQIFVGSLLRAAERLHGALALHMAKVEDERRNRERIDRMNRFFGDEGKYPVPVGWEKQRQWEEQT